MDALKPAGLQPLYEDEVYLRILSFAVVDYRLPRGPASNGDENQSAKKCCKRLGIVGTTDICAGGWRLARRTCRRGRREAALIAVSGRSIDRESWSKKLLLGSTAAKKKG